jgi:DNA-binding response OmpR family regulator
MGNQATVLIVDDEPILLETMAYNLEKAGFRVVKAIDGEGALRVTQAEKPQLIILDGMLPKLSGWQVCHTLRTEPGYQTNVPIVMLTARGEEEDRQRAMVAGATEYLLKPISMRVLVAKVRELQSGSIPG